MFEVERNSPIETEVLTEFFARCGWQDAEVAAKLEWVFATSEEWVACRLHGQLIGFGRSCRLDPVNRVVFDALVDPRFESTGLRGEIVRLLTENAGSLEVVSVFSTKAVGASGLLLEGDSEKETGNFPPASEDAYLGRRPIAKKGER